MTESNKQLPALGRGGPLMPINEAKSIGETFALAGLFDVSLTEAEKRSMTPEKKAAINTVKILAGQELGLGPFAAMKGLHVIAGKVTPGYQTMLALLRNTPGYDYKIIQNDREIARIQIFRHGKPEGPEYKFDTTDMQTAKLGGDNWTKYPAQMRLSKAVSMAVNASCPEVLGGTTYTPEDFDGAQSIECEEVKVTDAPKSEPGSLGAKTVAASAGQTPATTAKATATQRTTPATTATADPKVQAAAQSAAAAPTPETPTANAASNGATTGNTQNSTTVEIIEVTNLDDAFENADSMTIEQATGAMLETGQVNGWDAASLEDWFIGYLMSKGVPCDSPESIQANWTTEQINFALDYVTANVPPAPPELAT